MTIKDSTPYKAFCKWYTKPENRQNELSQIGATNPLVDDKANGLYKELRLLNDQKTN